MFAPRYLDFNATTPLHPQVLDAMLPYLQSRFGNPSSRHEYGRHSRAAIDSARQQVAELVGAHPSEVLFTSGGSEANNLYVKGVAHRMRPGSIAISAGEHPCVRQPANQLRRAGWSVIELPLDSDGALDLEIARDLVRKHRPELVSVMLANNETGVINDVAGLAGLNAWLHSDAVQAVGKIPVDFRSLGVHAMTFSAHKIHGPIGVGALITDKRQDIEPLVAGGGQEGGRRSGTENVAAIVGFGRACELARQEMVLREPHLLSLRKRLETGLRELGAIIFAESAHRLPNTCFFAFENIDGETLVGKLDRLGFALASGSACSSVNTEPSRTLLAMGVSASMARCAVRASMGYSNTQTDITEFLVALKDTARDLKGLAAVAI